MWKTMAELLRQKERTLKPHPSSRIDSRGIAVTKEHHTGKEANAVDPRRKKKVWLMLSGGIDSGVAVPLLLSQGYDVEGCYMKGWAPDWVDCIDPPERQASFDIAQRFGIPWRFLNYSQIFFDRVFDPMLSGYFNGVTPNPDTACNSMIKFGLFADTAFADGADYIASGHYVRKLDDPLRLLIARDSNKDQSYFLYDVRAEVLRRSLFPIGGFIKKDETVKMAREFGLPESVLTKRPTVDICFLLKKRAADGSPVGERITMRELLEREGEKRGVVFAGGPITDESGAVLGRHDGVMLYSVTIGQKIGYDPATKIGIQGSGARYYVVGKSIRDNTIVVGSSQKKLSEVLVTDLNWISGAPSFPFSGQARIRTPQEMQACRAVEGDAGTIRVAFTDLQHSVASGQALVLYDGDVVLGGGIITQ